MTSRIAYSMLLALLVTLTVAKVRYLYPEHLLTQKINLPNTNPVYASLEHETYFCTRTYLEPKKSRCRKCRGAGHCGPIFKILFLSATVAINVVVIMRVTRIANAGYSGAVGDGDGDAVVEGAYIIPKAL